MISFKVLPIFLVLAPIVCGANKDRVRPHDTNTTVAPPVIDGPSEKRQTGATGKQVKTNRRNLLKGNTKKTKGANDISDLIKSAVTCKSFPDEMKACFGDEDGKYGLASCDPKTNHFSEEACCARILGLKSCIGKEVSDSCDLGGALASLSSAGCDAFLSTKLSLESKKLNSRNESFQFGDNTVSDNHAIVTTYALSDETADEYLAYSNVSLVEFRAKIHENISKGTYMSNVVDQENRDLQMAVAVATKLTTIMLQIASNVLTSFLNDWRMREVFTSETVKQCREQLPGYSCVIVYDRIDHRVYGKNYVQKYHFLRNPYGWGYGYYLYATENGKPFYFWRNGDGGYVNWAANGYFLFDNDRTLTNSINFRGARVYEGADATGRVRYLPGYFGEYWFYNYEQFGNDVISSAQLDQNCCMIGYEAHYLQGRYQWFCWGYFAHFGAYGMNDQMSSCLVGCW